MPLDRRDFLSAAAALGVTGLATRSFSAEQPRSSPGQRIVCALIGAGGRGRYLTSLIAGRTGAAVSTVCDVNARNLAQTAELLGKKQAPAPRQVEDFRRVLDDGSIDAVFIATPHHWHTPIALRALEAGKHVYVEKPASHVFHEGRLLVEAAHRTKRVVQHGTQMRSSDVTAEAGKVLRSGLLGEIRMARAWSVEPRRHPAPVPDGRPPEHLDYDLWLGPAPKRPFNRNRLERWRWYRDYGNGEIGDDGVHDLDLARWGLGAETHPARILASAARIDLQGETDYPNHLTVSYQYADGRELLYETRNWAPYRIHGFDSGNAFYGTEGYMIFSRRGQFQTYLGAKEERGPGARGTSGNREHVEDFLAAIRSREPPRAGAETAHLTAALVHLGEIACRTGRALDFDPERETFRDDKDANALLTKDYRSPWGFNS